MKYLKKSSSNRQTLPYGKQGATVVFEAPDGSEAARVSFPASVCARINATTKKLGVSVDKFFDLAIAEKIGNAGHELDFSPIMELEVAKIQSNALLKLLADNMNHYANGGSSFEGEEIESMCAGVAELVHLTNARLEAAFDSVCSEFKSKRDMVPS